jgi:hypothetical protein
MCVKYSDVLFFPELIDLLLVAFLVLVYQGCSLVRFQGMPTDKPVRLFGTGFLGGVRVGRSLYFSESIV